MKMVGMVILSGIVLAGCGGAETKTAENTAPTKPAGTTPSTTPTNATTPGGSASTGSLPADFPKDVPVYPGATVVGGATAGAGSGAAFNTSDAPDKVASFYKDELPKNGWSKPIATDMAGMSSIAATKDKRRLGISVTKGQDGKTMISIGVSTT
jgi:hypothetical protein